MLRAPSSATSGTQQADLIILAGVTVVTLAIIVAMYLRERSWSGGAIAFAGIAALSYLAACAVVVLWIIARSVRRRIHKSPFLIFSAIVLIAPAIANPYPYARPAFDWIRFQFNRGLYEDYVAQFGYPKVQAFYWGQSGDSGAVYLLVFDESGEIMQPGAMRSEAWEKRVMPDSRILLDGGCADEAFYLAGHFYSVRVYCRRAD